jgi:hypothetical protein
MRTIGSAATPVMYLRMRATIAGEVWHKHSPGTWVGVACVIRGTTHEDSKKRLQVFRESSRKPESAAHPWRRIAGGRLGGRFEPILVNAKVGFRSRAT